MQTFTKLLLAGLLFAASGAFAQDQIRSSLPAQQLNRLTKTSRQPV